MSLKGFFSIFKGKDELPDYATLEPVQNGQMALSVAVRGYCQLIGADAVELGSTERVIAATAHAAKRGDIVSFTSGALATREVRVQETTTDTITLCEVLESVPANGVTFDILRDKAPTVGADGGIAVDTTGLALEATQLTLVGLVATSAKQDTQTGHLSDIVAATEGTEAAADALAGTIGTNNSAVPTDFVQVGGRDPSSGVGRRLAVDSVGAVSAGVTNLPTTVDTNTGAAGASTVRAVLATRHEAAATPLAFRPSDGAAFFGGDFGASAAAQRTAAQIGNATGAADFGSGASGAQTLRAVLATRHEAVATPLATQLSNGTAALAYGAGAAGATVLRVVPASDSPSSQGRSYADSARNDYSSANVTTGAWTQLIASTAADINALMIFDSSGQTLELGTGGGGSETRKLIIPQGGFAGPVPLRIPSGTRISVRAITATAVAGEINITGLN